MRDLLAEGLPQGRVGSWRGAGDKQSDPQDFLSHCLAELLHCRCPSCLHLRGQKVAGSRK